ncbi:MAG: hypothetical protein ABFD52_01530 [Acidobacteriota bacterium]
MRKSAFAVLVALPVIAAAACQNGPTGPKLSSAAAAKSATAGSVPGSTTTVAPDGLVGTWLATKAVACRSINKDGKFVEVPGSRRDLVAEGGAVTLVLETNGAYTVSVTMPGQDPSLSPGTWHYHEFWGKPQIDFYPSSLEPDYEYGEVPGFLVALSGDILKLWDGGLGFLPLDFGWAPHETCLVFEFIRK